MNRVAQKAEQLGLRSKRYVTQSGRDQGGQVMSRGHIHKILTNPLYVGRIAHKGTSHEGQHFAIIETAQWERVQAIMTAQSSIPRGQQNSGRPTSPLAGKLFDPSGARMTPVHTQKRGRRYDYYISQSLKAGADPEERADGWRLPARVLEDRIAAAVRTHLRAAVLHGLVRQADPIWISAAVARIDHGDINALAVIDRVCIGQDRLGITIDRKSLARSFGVSERKVDPEPLAFDAPVSLRRRGVETKLLLDGDALPRDETLIRNIAKGRAFLDLITSGLSAQDIARSNDLSIKRVQQIVEFAFLSPDVVRQIVEGRRPSFLTAEWCLRHEIPADWAVQKSLFSVA